MSDGEVLAEVVKLSDRQTKLFFDILQSASDEATLCRAVKGSELGVQLFSDILCTYLTAMDTKLDGLAPDLDGETYMAFMNWVLRQGHACVQLLMDCHDLEAQRAFWEGGRLRQASMYWGPLLPAREA